MSIGRLPPEMVSFYECWVFTTLKPFCRKCQCRAANCLSVFHDSESICQQNNVEANSGHYHWNAPWKGCSGPLLMLQYISKPYVFWEAAYSIPADFFTISQCSIIRRHIYLQAPIAALIPACSNSLLKKYSSPGLDSSRNMAQKVNYTSNVMDGDIRCFVCIN